MDMSPLVGYLIQLLKVKKLGHEPTGKKSFHFERFMKEEGTQEQGHDRTDVGEGVRKQVRMESGTRQRD